MVEVYIGVIEIAENCGTRREGMEDSFSARILKSFQNVFDSVTLILLKNIRFCFALLILVTIRFLVQRNFVTAC